MSELDPDRRARLLAALVDGGQTIITSADPVDGGRMDTHPSSVISVREGIVDV
ncbi:MAG TPA: hypothetical protein PKE32_00375 [Miltoncostaeaceae bacterium]|nr:hypothetical protein [Miltoncostaeaceae bacterium]